jgi:hypothetical protein
MGIEAMRGGDWDLDIEIYLEIGEWRFFRAHYFFEGRMATEAVVPEMS